MIAAKAGTSCLNRALALIRSSNDGRRLDSSSYLINGDGRPVEICGCANQKDRSLPMLFSLGLSDTGDDKLEMEDMERLVLRRILYGDKGKENKKRP